MFNLFKNLHWLLVFFLFSCVHTPELQTEQDFKVPYETVWKALVSIMKPYPIKVIDINKGYIETQELKGSKYWNPPHNRNADNSGLSAVIKVYVTYKRPFTKISIKKESYAKKDFFSSSKKTKSSLLEEHMLIYRLERELSIQRRLKN